jgi:hypothetical protein
MSLIAPKTLSNGKYLPRGGEDERRFRDSAVRVLSLRPATPLLRPGQQFCG